jgi:hypothetical protein
MGLQVLVGPDGPADLAYLPQDAKAVAFANVREVLDSELRSKLMSLRPDGAPDLDPDPDVDATGPQNPRDLFAATGVDLERDVDSVLASLSGDGNQARPLVVARGKFNNGLIESAILQHAENRARVETYKGTRMVVITEGSEALAVGFAEPGLLVLGVEDGVRRALDAKASGNNIVDNAELMKLVRDSDDGNAWAVARFDALTNNANLPPEIASRLPAISWFAASGHINGGLRATLRAETRDDASAQNLRQVLQGVLALARLQAGPNPGIDGLINTLQLGGTGKTVSIGFMVDPAMIDALSALMPRGPRGPREGDVPFFPGVMPPPPPAPPALPIL